MCNPYTQGSLGPVYELGQLACGDDTEFDYNTY